VKVLAYRNLRYRDRVVWSIKDVRSGLVIDRVGDALFKDAELRVSQAGRRRVLLEKRKNVHAGVRGVRIEPSLAPTDGWVRASYNPYKQESFQLADGTPVSKVAWAKLTETGLYIIKEAL
jgi:hypothetical protein